MRFKQPISADRQVLRQEAREGLGKMSNDEIRELVEAEAQNLAGVRKLLRQILRNQRNLTRQVARLRER